MQALLLIAALVSCVTAIDTLNQGFGDYSPTQIYKDSCVLPCLVNTSYGLESFDVRWYGKEDKSEEMQLLSNFNYWWDKHGVRYNISYPTSAKHWCKASNEISRLRGQEGEVNLLNCSHRLSFCDAGNAHNVYDRTYICSVTFNPTGQTFNVSSIILHEDDPFFDGADGTPKIVDCYFPSAENITATLYYDEKDVQRVNVTWDISERPPSLDYCGGSRQFHVRWLMFDTPNNIWDHDTRFLREMPGFAPLSRRETNFSVPVDSTKYYLFQLRNEVIRNSRTHEQNFSSHIYHFNHQEVPRFENTQSTIKVNPGDSVAIPCKAVGYPKPIVKLYRNGVKLPLVDNEYPLVDISEFELGDYYCSAYNILVNPPRGRHQRTVNKRITVEFNVETYPKNMNCEPYAGGLCKNYLYRDTTVFHNTSDLALEDNAATYMANFGLYKNEHIANFNSRTEAYSDISEELISKCSEFIEAIACSVLYPYCDHEHSPRPICKHSCDMLHNECAFFLDPALLPLHSYDLRKAKGELLANCDLRENPAGEYPECTYISLENPSIFYDDEVPQTLCVSGKGRGYNGNIQRTESIECQSWESQTPHKHSIRTAHFSTELLGAKFSCRNPGGLGERPWCYTTNPNMRWQYCDIPQCEQCNEYSGDFCAGLPGYSDGEVYTNSIDWPTGIVTHSALETTMSGLYHSIMDDWVSPGCQLATKTLICHGTIPLCTEQGEPRTQCDEHCKLFSEIQLHCPSSLSIELLQRWNYTMAVERLRQPNCGLEAESEQCMPSPGRITPTADKNTKCYNSSDRGQTYEGDIALSQSGKACMPWSQSPLTHTYPRLTDNFCRNPGQWRAVPWCFIDKYTVEECAVPECALTVNNPRGNGGAGAQSDTGTVVGVSFFLIILLVVGIVVAIFAILKFSRKKRDISSFPFQLRQVTSDKMTEMEYKDNTTYGSISPFPPKVAEAIATFQQIPQDKIEYVKQLGQGFFGMVFKGRLKSEVEGDPEMFVAVKTLKEDSNDGIEGFVNEAKLMFSFHHQNIVQILGVSMMNTPYYLVFEYMDKGDLAKFLRENASSLQRRHMSPNDRSRSRTESTLSDDPAALNNVQLVDLCQQIAKGMEYLSSMKHVHRDLACRNCLVKSIPEDGTTVTESKVIVKIGDFGLSHNLYTKDYYRVRGQAVLPIRWMSPEAIVYGKFSSAGDVWSFGVVMWEIFAFGMQPYYGISNEEVMERVRHGRVLERPMDCPDKVYSIMSECWAIQDKNRPTFEELCNLLDGCKLCSTSSDEDAQSMCSYDSGDVFESDCITDIED